MVRLTVLGSGSSGNCAVVSTGRTTLLIDAGLSAKQICVRLEAAGYSLEQIDGILLTHEHQDHTNGLEVLSSRRTLPLYATALTRETLQGSLKFRKAPTWRMMTTGSAFDFQDLRIECFPVPHDAVDPIGFVIADEESRLGVLSDVGFVTNLIKDRLKGADSLFVEANYDAQLLEADTKRPWATKQRISSRHGHLSNDQTAELIESVAHNGLHHVVLGHLSDDCNDPDRASKRVLESLHRAGIYDTQVVCAGRRCLTPTMEVARRRVVISLSTAIAPAPQMQQMAFF
ncbi:phosphoribosyl 1,2-cyclic phosphodiesterase [Prosthecobacter fusiformis]|uniref:Phosphoribosyl 1,2-cyclic phosphodiesterase n=1 Tax=Prosthecobacter fusiformis TaxID=48464 RepID=A0A4R7RXI7_9BACT|nr:MBL fold metallo-hydrolase [Prosthecobacter fusiformis]TDU70582.1 phosphoribosyl 1,2-cyclic phosphodiesterase [Prosthecobacter fusiformis]